MKIKGILIRTAFKVIARSILKKSKPLTSEYLESLDFFLVISTPGTYWQSPSGHIRIMFKENGSFTAYHGANRTPVSTKNSRLWFDLYYILVSENELEKLVR